MDDSRRIWVDSKGRAVVRDTGLRVGDVLDVRARFLTDEAMLERMPMLVRDDLEACRRWSPAHAPQPRSRIPTWVRFAISISVALGVAWVQYLVGGWHLLWPVIYFVLSFIAAWSAIGLMDRSPAA